MLALSMTVQLSMMAGAEVVSSDIDDSVAQSSIQEDKEVVNDSPVDVVLDDSKSVEENGDETQSRQDDESEKENVQLPAEKLLTNVEENPEPQEENVVVLQTEPLFEYTVNKSSQTVTITKYNGNETSVMVPDTLDGYSVTAIGDSAFNKNSTITEVILSDSITEIGNYAFRNCENLVNVDLPKNLVEIGYNVFQNDNKITALTIPATLQTANAYFPIGDTMHAPFVGMGGLKEIVFEAGTTKIPDSLFAGCSELESIVLPNTITKIGNSAFRECSNLNDVAIAAGQAQFGDNIFKNSQNVRLYGSASSNTALYAMENKVAFEIAGEFQDDESYILDRSGTNYFTDTNNVTANGYVTVFT